MTLLRAAALCLSVLLTASIVWASGAASIGASFSAIAADPWGLVALADLYLGFILFAVVVALFEPLRWVAVLAILATFVLGNVVTALWLAWRLPRLLARARLSVPE